MPDRHWKKRERQAAAVFGSKRQRCSGSSGREDCSRSDATHERLFIETKCYAKLAAVTLFDRTRALAKKEKRVPVLMLSTKSRPGFLVCCDIKDLRRVADEVVELVEATADAPPDDLASIDPGPLPLPMVEDGEPDPPSRPAA